MTLVVYVADGCPHCRDLLADLARRRVAATVVNLSVSPERLAELTAATWERSVPVTIDHERCSVGYRGRSTSLDDLGIGEPPPGRR